MALPLRRGPRVSQRSPDIPQANLTERPWRRHATKRRTRFTG
jgi:hypothetical protein